MKIGSLFSGAGGLDMAVEAVFGGRTVWHSEIDKAASKVLAHRWPDVPNLGSITEIDWASVEPVDVLCGGFPCQDVSAAGKRAGIKDGTRSGLWAVFADAIDALRPQYVIIENVRGLLSATAHRAVESDDAVVGDRSDRPVLRALGAVLGDLADIGYDARWATVAAASVGAPHRRERVFIIANLADTESDRLPGQELRRRVDAPQSKSGRSVISLRGYADAPNSSSDGWDEGRPESAGIFGGFDAAVSGDAAGVALLPTPCAQQSGNTPENHLAKKPGRRVVTDLAILVENGLLETGGALLPTPSACNANDGEGTETWLARREVVKARVKNGNGMGMPLAIAVQLLPTPAARDFKGSDTAGDHNRHSPGMDAVTYHFPVLLPTPEAKNSQAGSDYARMNREGSGGHDLVTAISLLPTLKAGEGNGVGNYNSPRHQSTVSGTVRELDQWGKYAPAIARWEQIVGPAPAPTEPNKNGNPRLSAAFSEWLMGWPAGWVTDPAIGISRNDQLRIVGNGVCTQQAIAALRYLLAVTA